MKKFYVNVYRVTRHYGGPEEGGWWFNWYECVKSIRVPRENFGYALKEKLGKEFIGKGNIYSVLGGHDFLIFTENRKAQSETKERPYYE